MNTKTKITALATTTLLLVGFTGPAQAAPEKLEAPSVAPTAALPVSAPVASLTFDRVSVKTSQGRHVRTSTPPAPVAVAPVVPQSAPVKAKQPQSAPKAPVKAKQPQTAPTTRTTPTKAYKAPVAPPAAVPASGKGATIAAAARGQLGVTQDCTALATNSLAAVGVNFHGWPAGYLSLGRTVSAAEAQPGDLAYYANGGAGLAHIAVYVGGGKAIHGGWNGNQTSLQSVNVGSGPVFIRVA